MEEDWFASLDEELLQKTQEILEDVGEQNNLKEEVNKEIIEDFWKIWIRFNQINIHFTMEPSHSGFAQFKQFPTDWAFKPKFNFGAVNVIQLIDRTQDQGRVGDSLKVRYYNLDKELHIRMIFEFCEGEHYYKYSGWKRIFGQHILYDAPMDRINIKKVHSVLADVIKMWYESHLRRNRDLLVKHLQETYEKGETFTQ